MRSMVEGASEQRTMRAPTKSIKNPRKLRRVLSIPEAQL